MDNIHYDKFYIIIIREIFFDAFSLLKALLYMKGESGVSAKVTKSRIFIHIHIYI